MKKVLCVCLLGVLVVGSMSAFSEDDEMMVDKADSLDFESFHEDSSITIFSTDGVGLFSPGSRADGVNTYEDDLKAEGEGAQRKQSSQSGRQQSEKPEMTATAKRNPALQKNASGFEQGQKVNIRASYRLGGSDDVKKATFSLYQQMNKYCPVGWEKLREWSLPAVGADSFYLHYQFRCL